MPPAGVSVKDELVMLVVSIDLEKAWFDHEANAGGGVFDLIRRQGYEQPAAWLRSEGLLGSPQIVSRAESCIVKNYDYRDENGHWERGRPARPGRVSCAGVPPRA